MEKDNLNPNYQNFSLDEEEFIFEYFNFPPEKILELKKFNSSLRELINQLENTKEDSKVYKQIDELIENFLKKECDSDDFYLVLPSHPYIAHSLSKSLYSFLVNEEKFSCFGELEDKEKLLENSQFNFRLIISEILTNTTKPQNINQLNKNNSFLIHIQIEEDKNKINFEIYDFNSLNPRQEEQMDIIRAGEESIQRDLEKKICDFSEGGRGLNIVALYCDKFDMHPWQDKEGRRIGNITKFSFDILSNKNK